MPYRLFSIHEAANYLHLTKDALETLVRQKEIPHEKQAGRTVFRKGELDEWASRSILSLSEKKRKAYHRHTTSNTDKLISSRAIMRQLIRPDFIGIDLCARTRPSILREMVDLATATDLVCDPSDLLASLQQREALCSTALPGGIAILHPRRHEAYMFTDSFIVLGRTIQPIFFGAADGTPTDLFFLICCQDDRLHLHVLARLCCMCHDTDMLTQLRTASDSGEFLDAVYRSEENTITTINR